MAEEQQTSGGWRATAYQVRGPGARRGPFASVNAPAGFAWGSAGSGAGAVPGGLPGDEGEVWIQDDALCFAGRRETWSVPLNWLADPETDLAGVTELRLRTADHGHAISLALAGGVEQERSLAAAIKAARTATPAPRDLRALADLTALLTPALTELDKLIPEGEPGIAPLDARYATQALALAARLRGAWLPYWGAPASRLRDATVGALLAAGVAARTAGDGATLDRAEQAIRRWRNVREDLQQWCGLPDEALPAARWPAGEHFRTTSQMAAPAAAPAAEPTYDPPLPTAPNHSAPPQPPATPPETVSPPVAPPSTSLQDEQGTIIIPAPNLPRPPEPASDEGNTLVIATPGQRPAAPPTPPAAEYDDRTVIAAPGRMPEDATPPLPSGTASTSAPAAVVTGPGRRGSGGMTMLYRRGGPGGSIARKELQPDDAARPEVAETFLSIGRRFQMVQHPNFVRILGVGREGATPYIDMEFVEGESMSARFGRAPVAAPQALQIASQIAEAIEAVHRAGLVHGDLRPQNVLIEPGGRVVLLEPSVACDYALEHARGTVYGDLAYLTPERASPRGDQQNAASDIYALATLSFALLAGRPPFIFSGNDPGQIFTSHAEEPPPALDRLLPGTPPAASAVLARALSKQPNERPASAVAFVADLQRAFGVAGAAASPPPTEAAGWNAQPGGVAPPTAPQSPPPSPVPPSGPPPARPAASPLGNRGASPLGNRGASPLGRPSAPPTPPPPDDEPPDDDLDKTVIVRPR